MSEDHDISTKSVGISIPLGAFIGILASFVTEVDISRGFSFGVAGGILTAALLATIVKKKGLEISYITLTSLGLGLGTVVGIISGLLTAWSLGGQYTVFFSVGAGLGLLGGALLGVLTVLLARK